MNKINENQEDVFRIRPAGRHILTIGRDLIKDKYAAIVELVKNAYDADSPDVVITFNVSEDRKSLSIVVEDHGHGMTRDTVINQWLVPSTDDKLKRKRSPNGRTMQGQKGVGRYAASILGDDLLLETVTKKGEKTTVYVEWNDFEQAKFLDDVEILVETTKTKEPQGTKLTIFGSETLLYEWKGDLHLPEEKRPVNELEKELKKLISPLVEHNATEIKNEFKIIFGCKDFWEKENRNNYKELEPFPLLSLFDYRIEGAIEANGKGVLTYTNQRSKNTIEEQINFDLKKETNCGKLIIDIRVYDREKDAIEQLVKRGLKSSTGAYLGNLEARRLLNDFNGIGVYRNGFRIRPLGDPDFDWLELNKKRIQTPSRKIGSNQVIGCVQIQQEEFSRLEEKSARDGLKENNAYKQLIAITNIVISELETKRFVYRRKVGLSRSNSKVEGQLGKLYKFDDTIRAIQSTLKKSRVDSNTIEKTVEILTKKEEESNQIAESISQAVAVYQGQATLGKIINIILHEVRPPLGYFKSKISNLEFWSSEFKKSNDADMLSEIISLAEGYKDKAEYVVELFNRLDPLAAKKRSKKKKFNLSKAINKAFDVFENELISKNIKYNIEYEGSIAYEGWEQDLLVIFTNLIDNSIYWMAEKKIPKRRIDVTVSLQNNEFEYIDYRDTGPGIEKNLIETEVIFEPEFSTKPSGMGLGLAIAGEAASRNGLELKAYESDTGAYFRLQTKKED